MTTEETIKMLRAWAEGKDHVIVEAVDLSIQAIREADGVAQKGLMEAREP